MHRWKPKAEPEWVNVGDVSEALINIVAWLAVVVLVCLALS